MFSLNFRSLIEIYYEYIFWACITLVIRGFTLYYGTPTCAATSNMGATFLLTVIFPVEIHCKTRPPAQLGVGHRFHVIFAP